MEAAMKPVEEYAESDRDPRGIVIWGGARPARAPLIAAFIWGGKVRPVPTLPFGRWKPVTT